MCVVSGIWGSSKGDGARLPAECPGDVPLPWLARQHVRLPSLFITG